MQEQIHKRFIFTHTAGASEHFQELIFAASHIQLSHINLELHIMNKSRMIYFSINANQMFLQQSPLAKPSIQKGIMNEQFWYAIVFFESIHVKKKKRKPQKNPNQNRSCVLVYTKPIWIACERLKRTLFCVSAYMLCSVTVTVQETDAQHDCLVQLWFCLAKNVHYNGSASKQQNTRQWEKPSLDVNTNIVTRLQKLEV